MTTAQAIARASARHIRTEKRYTIPKTHKHTHTQTHMHANTHADTQTQTDRQTDTHTYSHTHNGERTDSTSSDVEPLTCRRPQGKHLSHY